MSQRTSAEARARFAPPWSGGANNPAVEKGCEFHVPDVNNVPDLHGNPADARLVLFIGGNQFFVLPKLIDGFVQHHPELRGAIFYETLPPGILRRQMAANGALTLGNLTLQVRPDVYEAGGSVLQQMQAEKQVVGTVKYASNSLAIMVAAANPRHVESLRDLGRSEIRLCMPNPEWEGIARHISSCLRKAGGDELERTVYMDKVASGSTMLTEIHHRQTPMRIMEGEADAGVTWASEVQFQEKIGNPIAGVEIPAAENSTAVYAAGILADAPHATAARAWLGWLRSERAQSIYREFGFGSVPAHGR